MPSFVLSETLKYLYLLYNNVRFFNGSDSQQSSYRGMEYLFTTEGHLFNISRILTQPRIREVLVFSLGYA